jgi:hypothetical protein
MVEQMEKLPQKPRLNMKTKEEIDKEFAEWIASFPKYMEPDDGKLYVIRNADDMQKVHDDLFKVLGE